MESEEKVKLGLVSNHWGDRERWAVRSKATKTLSFTFLSFFVAKQNTILLIASPPFFFSCQAKMWKFYLKIEKEKWTVMGRSWRWNKKKDRTRRREPGLLSASTPFARRSVEKRRGWTYSWRPQKKSGHLKLEYYRPRGRTWDVTSRSFWARRNNKKKEKKRKWHDCVLLPDWGKRGRFGLNWTRFLTEAFCIFLHKSIFVLFFVQ